MQSIERLNEALRETAEAAMKVAQAFVDCFCEIAADFLRETIVVLTAYNVAAKERSEWVHMATYSKKKRIRKKYHDRIMRNYGRADHDNK